MLATNIEHNQYSSLGDAESRSMHPGQSSSRRSRTSNRRQDRKCRCSGCCCGALMWRLINCFKNSGQDQILTRPVVTESAHIPQYQAPVVAPSPRAGSVSSCDEDQDFERGTLLPKVTAHSPEPARPGAASSSAAAEAAAAGQAAQEPARHRRTGSDGSRGQLEGVRALVLPAAAAGGAGTTAAAAKAAKYGGVSGAEFAAVAELLGADADDEDFCPTCLEPYSDDNPKIFTRCGHSFHMQCIYAWLERKNTCPLCESPMDLQDDIML